MAVEKAMAASAHHGCGERTTTAARRRPRKIAGQRRAPPMIRPAKAIPDAGQTAVPAPGAMVHCRPQTAAKA
jgi:hypothetical protein